MDIQDAYDQWSSQYDTNVNKTRDLEAKALREVLGDCKADNCLEIGCGTGKNTQWLLTKAKLVTAVDFSSQMLAKARAKITSANVRFVQADITQSWKFVSGQYQLITFSLVLEHIENLNHVFGQVSKALEPGGLVYLGELHPFKQYSGSKAKFGTEHGEQVVTCYTHHISAFTFAAKNNGLQIAEVREFFDDDNDASLPRVLTLLFRKP